MADSAGDKVDMWIGDTERLMTRLGTVGAGLAQAWSTTARQVSAGLGQLGGGPMGELFIAAYRPAHQQLHSEATETAARTGRIADAGQRSVIGYGDADAESAQSLTKVNYGDR